MNKEVTMTIEKSICLENYNATLDQVSVHFRGDRDMAAHIANAVHPFIAIAHAEHRNSGSWSISPAHEFDLQSFQVFKVCPAGEPERSIWVSFSSRVICFDYSESVEWRAQECLRILRDLLKLTYQQMGHGFYHAGLVKIQGKGVLLAAPSRSGKTTLILALASKVGAEIVSNDDVSLVLNDGAIHGSGWPRSTSVRLDTFKAIGSEVYNDYSHLFLHPANKTILQLKERGIEKAGTVLLYPHEIERYFDAKLCTHSKVDLIIFPKFCLVTDKSMVLLTPTQAGSKLKSLNITNPAQHREFLMSKNIVGRGDINFCAVTSIPSYELNHSFDDVSWTITKIMDKLKSL